MFTKAYSVVLSLLMVFSLCVFETGCTSSQFDSTLATINNQLPAALALAEDIAALVNAQGMDPNIVKVGAVASTDLPVFQKAVSAYLASKSSGTKAAVFAAITSFSSNFNSAFLAANTVSNQKSQQAILTKFAAFAAVVNGFQLVLAPFFNQTVKAKADFQQVQPYIPRDVQEATAEQYGYTMDQLGM